MSFIRKPIPMGFDPELDEPLRQDLCAARSADCGYDMDKGLSRLQAALVTGAVASSLGASASVKAAASVEAVPALSVSSQAATGIGVTTTGSTAVVTVSGTVAKAGTSLAPQVAGVSLWAMGAKLVAGGVAGAATVATIAALNGVPLSPFSQGEELTSLKIAPEPVFEGSSEPPVDVVDEPAEAPAPEVDDPDGERDSSDRATPARKGPSQRRKAGTPKDARVALLAEMDQLARARHAMTSDPSAALSILERGEDEYPDGLFGEERDALSVMALLRLDRPAEAARRAAEFLSRYPSSTFATSMQALLPQAEVTQTP